MTKTKKRKVIIKMENQNNGKATAALILGILSIVLIWVPIINLILGIIALILGIKGLKKSKEQQE
ncbi:hypothetical protein K9L67_01515, partial [Candidatus Woesearchaeota archaeon]|nr:hypothetical protein [Candidatus Woesearchaeota archaeon]MCF7900881.1 hypothetical protein [Candidatus Woesearchaeota archaeon]